MERNKIKLAEAGAKAIERNKQFNKQFQTPTVKPLKQTALPADTRVIAKQPLFEDRHKRVTTYIENPLHQRIVQLKSTGQISSITALINAALAQYLPTIK